MAEAGGRKLAPALTASALLHLAVIGAGLVAWPWLHKAVPVVVTPVTLLTSAELARLTAAQQAPKPQQQTTPDPTPEAPPAPPPTPRPAPTPTPPPAPAPQPKPSPAPRPTPAPAPAPKSVAKPIDKPVATRSAAAATQTPATKGVDLDALAKSLALNTKAAGPTAAKSAAPKGPAKPETDLADRAPDGQARATSQTALGQIRDKLIRLWSPNCGIDTAANVHLLVRMNLNVDGSLIGRPQLVDYKDVDAITDPTLKASALRALSAVSRGAPYDSLPRDDYNFWKSIVLNFDAKAACGGH